MASTGGGVGSLPLSLELVAGDIGGPGSVDGTGADARFRHPRGVAVDSAGNLYVADTSNSTIRKSTPAGVVTTLVGTAARDGSADGTGTAARLSLPSGVAVDSTGNVYVADDCGIRKVTSDGAVTTLAGAPRDCGSADGTGAAASFEGLHGVAADGAGNVYVADSFNSTLRKVTPAGVVTTLAGTAGIADNVDGTGAAARFVQPEGVAVDGAGSVYVADEKSSILRKVTPAGVVTTLAGTPPKLGSADGIGGTARFNGPVGVAADAAGNLYVADSSNNTIRKVTPAGVVTTLAGTAGTDGSADGTGAAARFSDPFDVAVDRTGNVYVVDSGNSTIRKITPDGVVTTLAGMAGMQGSADGTGSAARFIFPSCVTVDSLGNVYVGDGNNTIRKITAAGVVTTLAGTADMAGSADDELDALKRRARPRRAPPPAGKKPAATTLDDELAALKQKMASAPPSASPKKKP